MRSSGTPRVQMGNRGSTKYPPRPMPGWSPRPPAGTSEGVAYLGALKAAPALERLALNLEGLSVGLPNAGAGTGQTARARGWTVQVCPLRTKLSLSKFHC